jgi:hypothetical protein
MDDLRQLFMRPATEASLIGYSQPVRNAILRAREEVARAQATKPITLDDLPSVSPTFGT